MDIDLMKRLQDRVNVIPIIAKADTLTRGEVNRLKARVRSDIQSNDIKVSLFAKLLHQESLSGQKDHNIRYFKHLLLTKKPSKSKKKYR